jgi:hypothetical protein
VTRKVIKAKSILKNRENTIIKEIDKSRGSKFKPFEDYREKSIKIDPKALEPKEMKESLKTSQELKMLDLPNFQALHMIFNHELISKQAEDEYPGESQLNKLLVKKIDVARGVVYRDNFGHTLKNEPPELDPQRVQTDTSLRMTKKQYLEYVEKNGRIIRRGPSPDDFLLSDDSFLPPIISERKKSK